jgi:hypothetical protein
MLVLMTPVALLAGEVRVGLIGGASVLERKDTSLTHGPLQDEITVGRTWLAGAAIDIRFTDHDSLAFEFVYGPYHRDVERSCMKNLATGRCDLEAFNAVSGAFLYGMQYARSFGQSAWRPFAGVGFGIKRWSYQEEWAGSVSRASLSLSVGAESHTRTPVRLEFRTMIVPQNPFLLDKTQIEMQARVTILLSRKK